MEKLDIFYEEYKRMVDRHNQLLDSSFNDFKLYGIIGPVLLGSSKFVGDYFNINGDILFAILLLIELLISIIAFRDLLKQIYINHLGYNINRMEVFLRDKILIEAEKEKFEIFNIRKSWIEKYFPLTKETYISFILVLFLTITIIPFFILWNMVENGRIYAIILTLIISILFTIYVLLALIIFKKSNKNEI